MSAETIKDVVTEELKSEIMTLNHQATTLIIGTPEQFISAGNILQSIKGWIKQVNDKFEEPIRKARDAWKGILGIRDEILKDAENVEFILKQKISVFQAEERKMIEMKKAKQIDQYHKNQEKAKEKAEKLVAEGKDEQAAEVLTNVKVPDKPIPEITKISGISTKEDWDIEITNPDEVPREFCTPDVSAIRRIVKAMKGKIVIAGIKVITKTIIVSKSKF